MTWCFTSLPWECDVGGYIVKSQTQLFTQTKTLQKSFQNTKNPAQCCRVLVLTREYGVKDQIKRWKLSCDFSPQHKNISGTLKKELDNVNGAPMQKLQIIASTAQSFTLHMSCDWGNNTNNTMHLNSDVEWNKFRQFSYIYVCMHIEVRWPTNNLFLPCPQPHITTPPATCWKFPCPNWWQSMQNSQY